MKIILSPSKTQEMKHINRPTTTPLYVDKNIELRNELKKYNEEEISNMYKIKNNLLKETVDLLKNYDQLEEGLAISSYTGAVFKNLDILTLEQEELDYIMEYVTILSAQYGVLRASDTIHPYRLDYLVKLPFSLTKYWHKEVNDYFKNDEIIINLASNEFSKMIEQPMIHIEFMELVNGKYKVLSTYAKQARGIMLRYMAKNRIVDLNELKRFNQNGYTYNEELSTDHRYIFTRTKEK